MENEQAKDGNIFAHDCPHSTFGSVEIRTISCGACRFLSHGRIGRSICIQLPGHPLKNKEDTMCLYFERADEHIESMKAGPRLNVKLELAECQASLKRAIAFIKTMEYCAYITPFGPCCPVCGTPRQIGHGKACPLAEVLEACQ